PSVPEDSLNEVTGITIVFRAKPSPQSISADSFVVWWYISIRASGSISFETDLQMYKDTLEMIGFNNYPPGGDNVYYSMVGDTNWHTWRVTQLRQDVKVYMDENPNPVIDTKTYGTDPGANHLRIGKQDRADPNGGYFDYFLILEGAIYAPGEGPEIPDAFIVDRGPNAVEPAKADTPDVLLYPNPASDHITVYYSHSREANPLIEIYSITGQKVKELRAGSALKTLVNIQDLQPGIYILKSVGKYIRFVKR
ncbi:MAG: T9SS type A sorting domain-containing protein, partial [Methanosarcinaceae archaeon]